MKICRILCSFWRAVWLTNGGAVALYKIVYETVPGVNAINAVISVIAEVLEVPRMWDYVK